ncbi:MAG: hypothetical protein KIS61_11395 [Candidatus Eremiobacteraeota bacterium]|nr:hypothetical protein [Candidatus Eremiobacteraeota bacterium]
MFLAETVAVAIEVKSNLQSQWPEVLRTARQVKKLCRQFKRDAKLADAANLASVAVNHEPKHAEQLREISRALRAEASALPAGPGESIPVYVVGFCGWKNAKALEKRLIGAMDGDVRLVDGVFQLNIQAWRCCHGTQLSQTADGSVAMLTFIDALEWYLNHKVVPQRLAWSYLVQTREARRKRSAAP